MTTSFFLTFSHENHLQEGNSVDLPSSVLEKYTDENKSLPFFFKLKPPITIVTLESVNLPPIIMKYASPLYLPINYLLKKIKLFN